MFTSRLPLTPIGHEHAIECVEYQGDKCAIVKVYHWRQDGTECTPHHVALADGTWAKEFAKSGVMIRSWSVISRDPLTLSPSILCSDPGCKDHGFIENGKWRPA